MSIETDLVSEGYSKNLLGKCAFIGPTLRCPGVRSNEEGFCREHTGIKCVLCNAQACIEPGFLKGPYCDMCFLKVPQEINR